MQMEVVESTDLQWEEGSSCYKIQHQERISSLQ